MLQLNPKLAVEIKTAFNLFGYIVKSYNSFKCEEEYFYCYLPSKVMFNKKIVKTVPKD